MVRKFILGAAAAVAVTLGAGAMTTPAEAGSLTITVDTYGGYHDRGYLKKVHGPRYHQRGHHGHWRHHHGQRPHHWRHKGWHHAGQGYRHHGKRQVCHVHKKFVTYYDGYGRPHRKVKHYRDCNWVRR
ncbi:MAG: hypothetical protein AAGF59_04710 [Pseudomonadota bacterium]